MDTTWDIFLTIYTRQKRQNIAFNTKKIRDYIWLHTIISNEENDAFLHYVLRKHFLHASSANTCSKKHKSMHLPHMQNLTSHVNLMKSSSFTFTTISCIHYEHTVNTLAEIFAYGYVQKLEILRKKKKKFYAWVPSYIFILYRPQ